MIRNLHVILKRAVRDFIADDCLSAAAAIAFYTIFSLPPLLIIIFGTANWFEIAPDRIERIARKQVGLPLPRNSSLWTETERGDDSVVAEPAIQGQEVAPPENALAALAKRGQIASDELGPVSRTVGIAMLIISASWVFAQLQYSLNRAWEVEPDPQQGGMRNFVLKRMLSLGMIVVFGFLLLVSLVLTTIIDELAGLMGGAAPDPLLQVFVQTLNALASFVLATLLFASMFKILPDAQMSWKFVWLGSAVTAVLFVIGKFIIAAYLNHFDIGASWGAAAASMVAMLMWVYYSSLIVLFGAEFTQAWVHQHGWGVEPAEGAVRTVAEKHHIPPGSTAQAT